MNAHERALEHFKGDENALAERLTRARPSFARLVGAPVEQVSDRAVEVFYFGDWANYPASPDAPGSTQKQDE